jgi:hypothetical protein
MPELRGFSKKEVKGLENWNKCLEIVWRLFKITVPIPGLAAPGFLLLVLDPELEHINRAVAFVPVTRAM